MYTKCKMLTGTFGLLVTFMVVVYFAQVIKPPPTTISKECGKRSSRESLNNGSRMNISAGVWPWQVSILYRATSSGPFTQICGGAIVHKSWVMTAASCTSVDTRNLLIRAGSNRLDVDDEFTQQLEVARIIRHNEFNPVTLEYSIALLEVKTPFELNDFVSPICVPDIDAAKHKYESCHVTGFDPQPGGDVYVLREAEVHLMLRTLCVEQVVWDHTVSTDMLCISKFNESADECETQTNLGGPLSCYIDVLQSYYLIGLRVKASTCGEPKQPMVYIKVHTLYNWIGQEMNITLH